jgi:hypothetical protein
VCDFLRAFASVLVHGCKAFVTILQSTSLRKEFVGSLARLAVPALLLIVLILAQRALASLHKDCTFLLQTVRATVCSLF